MGSSNIAFGDLIGQSRKSTKKATKAGHTLLVQSLTMLRGRVGSHGSRPIPRCFAFDRESNAPLEVLARTS